MEEKSDHVKPETTLLNEKSPSSTNILTIIRNSPTNAATQELGNLNTTPYVAENNSTSSLSSSPSMQHEKSAEEFESSTRPSDLKPHAVISQHSFQGDDDIEAQNFTSRHVPASLSKTGLITSDPMWPNRHDLKLRRKAMKREKASCTCWASMSRKQRGIISTIIILVILGAGLGVGFGISKRVGGGVVNIKGTKSSVSLR